MPANVLYVIPNLNIGGTEIQLGLLARGLAKTEFQPHILCVREEGELADSLRKFNIPVEGLGIEKPISFGACRKIKKQCIEWDIDIVHTFLFGMDLAAVRGARSAGVLGVITSRRQLPDWKNWKHLKAQRMANDRTDLVICNSKAVQEFCCEQEDLGIGKTEVIHNGFPEQNIPSGPMLQEPPVERELLRSRMIEPKEKVLACVANFSAVKNHFKMIDALRNILLDGELVRLILIGDGPMREEVQSYVESKSMREAVIFLGSRLDRLKILPECQALILPSKHEGFPNAVLEAMALGIPVIASNTGGIPELIDHGETGWLFPPDDELDMAATMRKVLFDHDAALQCATKAQEKVRKKFTDRILIENHLKIYRDLMKRKVQK
ncbi:MAG: glycosyltransferase [Candidatus Omnitrophica bacterium]|nr:glycosyltransferase [Candidatus Omnitrophota bacterium]